MVIDTDPGPRSRARQLVSTGEHRGRRRHRGRVDQQRSQRPQRRPRRGRRWAVETDDFGPDAVYEHTFDEPGTYRYYCSIHGTTDAGMVGPSSSRSEPQWRHHATMRPLAVGRVAGSAGRRRLRRRRRRRRGEDEARRRTEDDPAVPDDYDTIQAAVDAAEPGDLVLVSPGHLRGGGHRRPPTTSTIRGLDRNEVILDGEFELENGIRVVEADGVAIENMTARNYTEQRLLLDRRRGLPRLVPHRLSATATTASTPSTRPTACSSTRYASGSPDAGFYIGQCYPCDAVIDDVVSEYNGLGYSGTNSGGNLLHRQLDVPRQPGRHRAQQRQLRAVLPRAGDHDRRQPRPLQQQLRDAPAIDAALLAIGNGILVAGGIGNVDRAQPGVRPRPSPASASCPSPRRMPTTSCRRRPTTISPAARTRPSPPPIPADSPTPCCGTRGTTGSSATWSRTRAWPTSASVAGGRAGLGNCFADNELTSTAPADLETLAPCEGDGSGGDWTAGALDLRRVPGAEKPPSGDYKDVDRPDPTTRRTCPTPRTPRPRPATDVPGDVDVDAIEVPAGRATPRDRRSSRSVARRARSWRRSCVATRGRRCAMPSRPPRSACRRRRPDRRGGSAVRRRMSLQPRRPRRPDRALRPSRPVTPAHVLRQHRHRRLDHGCRPGRRRHHVRAEARPGVVLGPGAARATAGWWPPPVRPPTTAPGRCRSRHGRALPIRAQDDRRRPGASRPQPLDIVAWACGTGPERHTTPPACPEGRPLRLLVSFPDCWDGEHLDSDDHAATWRAAPTGRARSHIPWRCRN